MEPMYIYTTHFGATVKYVNKPTLDELIRRCDEEIMPIFNRRVTPLTEEECMAFEGDLTQPTDAKQSA